MVSLTELFNIALLGSYQFYFKGASNPKLVTSSTPWRQLTPQAVSSFQETLTTSTSLKIELKMFI